VAEEEGASPVPAEVSQVSPSERRRISTRASSSANSLAVRGHASYRMRRSSSFLALPQRTQMTCGGGPYCPTKLQKSWSFVSRATVPASRAAEKISRSRARCSPRTSTWSVSMLRSVRNHCARDGGNRASTQTCGVETVPSGPSPGSRTSPSPPQRDGQADGPNREGWRRYRRVPGRDTPQESLPVSHRRRAAAARRQRGCACLEYRAAHHFPRP
jgi:hypothetical protein